MLLSFANGLYAHLVAQIGEVTGAEKRGQSFTAVLAPGGQAKDFITLDFSPLKSLLPLVSITHSPHSGSMTAPIGFRGRYHGA